MGFRIPHTIVKELLPQGSQVRRQDWDNLVKRADQLEMNRRADCESATLEDGYANEYEGTWLQNWMGKGYGARLFPREAELVHLFHGVTRQPDTIKEGMSSSVYAPVPAANITGNCDGVDLAVLAQRVASTNLENRDGDPTHVEIEALSDANEAHTRAEKAALRVILREHFKRDATIESFADEQTGVKVRFEVKESPVDFEVCSRTKAKYEFDRSFDAVEIDAPPGSRVSYIPQGNNCWLAQTAVTADVGADGKARFPLGAMPPKTDTLAIYVVHDGDAAAPEKLPRLLKRLEVKLPYKKFYSTFDKSERLARLEAGRSGQ